MDCAVWAYTHPPRLRGAKDSMAEAEASRAISTRNNRLSSRPTSAPPMAASAASFLMAFALQALQAPPSGLDEQRGRGQQRNGGGLHAQPALAQARQRAAGAASVLMGSALQDLQAPLSRLDEQRGRGQQRHGGGLHAQPALAQARQRATGGRQRRQLLGREVALGAH